MKKFTSLALAITMMFGMSSTAFAAASPAEEPPVKAVLSDESEQALTDFIQDIYQHCQNSQFRDSDIQDVVRNFYINLVPKFASSFENGQSMLEESCTPYAAASYHPEVFPSYITDESTFAQWNSMDAWNSFDFSELNFLGAHSDLAGEAEPGTVEYFHVALLASTSHFFFTFGDLLNSSYIHSTEYHGTGITTEKGIMEVYALPLWLTMGHEFINLEFTEMYYTGYKDISEVWAGDVLASQFLALSLGVL